jgi:hypothetical protein
VAVVRSRLGIVLPFLLAAVLALGGCGDDPSEPDADPTGQSSSSDPSEPPPETSTSTEPTPTVEPAAGELMELSNVSVRAPKGYQADPPDMSYLRFAFERAGIQSIALANTPAVNETLPLHKQAVISIRNHVYSQVPPIGDPVEIGGVTMYRYAGQVSDNEYVEEYGAIYDGSQISINFLLSATSSEDERRELVDSVLATLTFS